MVIRVKLVFLHSRSKVDFRLPLRQSKSAALHLRRTCDENCPLPSTLDIFSTTTAPPLQPPLALLFCMYTTYGDVWYDGTEYTATYYRTLTCFKTARSHRKVLSRLLTTRSTKHQGFNGPKPFPACAAS